MRYSPTGKTVFLVFPERWFAILPDKIPPSGGTSAAAAAPTQKLPLACRANSPTIGGTPATSFPNHAVSYRRDDRAMITQKRAGRRELPFTLLPRSFQVSAHEGPPHTNRDSPVISQRMYRVARSPSNQGDGEGVYDCTRLSWRPPI